MINFFMSIGILTFCMVGERLYKVLDMVSKGMPAQTLLTFTLYVLPVILTYTIPWAIIVSVMLLFGRLSADSEITAMRACGISILQIISPILLITFALSAFCFFLQLELSPPLLGKSRFMMEENILEKPTSIFQPGQQISWDKHIVYIGGKKDNELSDIQIFAVDDSYNLTGDITAERGVVTVDKVHQQMKVTLYNCVVNDRKKQDGESQTTTMKESDFKINYGEDLNRKRISVKPKYMTLFELFGYIKASKMINRNKADICKMEVELNQRVAFSLAPISFLVLGLPLAIRTSRRETSVGLFLSVILAGFFFLSIILCNSLSDKYFLYPQYLLWIPNLLYQVVGAILIYRVSQR